MKKNTVQFGRRTVPRSRQAGLKTLVLGTGPLARQIVRAILEHGEGQYELLGAIAESGAANPDPKAPGCRVLGTIDRLEALLAAFGPERIVVAVMKGRLDVMERLLLFLIHSDAVIIPAVDLYESLTGQVPIDALTPDDLVFGNDIRPRTLPVCVNRIVSVVLATIGGLLALPGMVVIAIAVKLDSNGPALFVQDRAGLEGRRFRLLKFRTMRQDAGEHSVWAGENADRITRVGTWLRKYRLDELPQLFNILKGDMNLVGPRPHPSPSCELVELISRNVAECGVAMPYYTIRSMVRPGITGWAQVRYKYANGLGEEMEKLRYDLYYIKHYSIWLNLRILMTTLAVVARGVGNGGPEKRRLAPVNRDAVPLLSLRGNREEEASMNRGRDGITAHRMLETAPERRTGAGG